MADAFALTYDGLVDRIQAYLERKDQDVLDQIPFAIALTESKLANELKQLGQLRVVQTPLVPTNSGLPNGTLAKPVRWRRTVSMNIVNISTNEKSPLYLRTYEYCRNYWPESPLTDTPLYYCDYDFDHWLIVPTPPSNTYMLESLIYQRLDPLSSSNQTNWFTQSAPEALFYGALLEMIPFLKNDQRVATWQPKYDAALAALKLQDGERTVDRSATKPENAQ